MRIIEWTGKDVNGLARRGLTRILTECDVAGQVVREIGLSGDDVRYIASAADPHSTAYGLFDLAALAPEGCTGPDDVPRELFERYWQAGLARR